MIIEIISAIIILVATAWIDILIAKKAEKWGRDRRRWIFITIIIGPVFSLVFLLILGKTKELKTES